MIDARIDLVSPAGVAEGWARCENRFEPVEVTLWLADRQVGAATASAFRRDLLAAGIGHGHYAYRCKISMDEVAHGVLELRESGGNKALASFAIEPGTLTFNRHVTRRTIESLLVAPARWSMGDVEAHPEALDLETNLMQLGPKRYIAMVYRFLLGRWPGAHEYDFYLPNLRRDLISATDIFRTVFNSAERKNNGLEPMSPFDPGYTLRGRREQLHSPGPAEFDLQDPDPAVISSAILESKPRNLPSPAMLFEDS